MPPIIDDKKEEKNLTAEEASEKALSDLSSSGKEGKKEEPVVEKKEPEKKEETAEELETRQAKELYAVLKGPNGADMVKFLAEQAGLFVQAGVVDKKEAKKEVTDLLKEALGEDYSFLSDKMGPAIKAMVDSIVDEKVGKVKEVLQRNEEKEFKKDYETAWDKVDAASKGDLSKHAEKVAELTKDYPFIPSKTNTLERYLANLLKLSGSEAKVEEEVEKVVDRINKNAKETKIVSSDVDPDRVQEGPLYPTVEEAVQAAYLKLAAKGK